MVGLIQQAQQADESIEQFTLEWANRHRLRGGAICRFLRGFDQEFGENSGIKSKG